MQALENFFRLLYFAQTWMATRVFGNPDPIFQTSQMPERDAAIQHRTDCVGRDVGHRNKMKHLVY